VFAVCAYCGSTVVRTDRDVESIGTMADLPDEMTPLQIGTELSHGGTHYTLIGRVRVGWADGAWNEWYMGHDSTAAWLVEAQGFLAVAVPQSIEEAGGIDATGLPRLEALVTVKGRTYRVTDIKEAACLGSEGELPFRAPRGRRATYIDMIDDVGGFASIESSDDGRQLYTGEYVPFDRLGFRNLRDIEGWKPPARPFGRAASMSGPG
jgi:hypothetical protein